MRASSTSTFSTDTVVPPPTALRYFTTLSAEHCTLGAEAAFFEQIAAEVYCAFKRPGIEQLIEIGIALLDTLDGNADAEDDDPIELNGDERDGSISSEDEFR